MSASAPRTPAPRVDPLDRADHVRAVFQREPTARELEVYGRSRAGLLLRLPGQVRRRAARTVVGH